MNATGYVRAAGAMYKTTNLSLQGVLAASRRRAAASPAKTHRALSTTTRQMRTLTVPPDAWDSHMHVLEPGYPLAASAVYAPHDAPLGDAQANAARLALPNLVFVQPSPYGTDNACQLDALARHGPAHGRAVVVIDPATTTPEHLHALHARGARAARVNLKSVGATPDADELEATLAAHAALLRPLRSWALQIYADLALVPQVEALAAAGALDGVALVLDHMGGPPAPRPDMRALPGWDALLRLLERPRAFVKISAAYRFGDGGDGFAAWEPVVRPLLAARGGEAAVFASDWPHTRHEGVDVRPWVARCLEWCDGDEALRDRLFRDNARRLWDAVE